MLIWLAKIRKERELTTYEAAKLIGISQSFYWAIENGTRGVPVKTAKRIASALNFDWQFFYNEQK